MSKKDKPLNYQQRQSIKFVDNGDPPFIKAMKAQMGYRDTTIEDKVCQMFWIYQFSKQFVIQFAPDTYQTEEESREDDDIRNLKEEERPQVVVLNEKTDMTQDEFDKEVKKKEEEKDKKMIEEGKIAFKKPAKRANEESVDDAAKEDVPKDKTLRIEAEKKRDADIKKKQNKNLLSFGDEEDE